MQFTTWFWWTTEEQGPARRGLNHRGALLQQSRPRLMSGLIIRTSKQRTQERIITTGSAGAVDLSLDNARIRTGPYGTLSCITSCFMARGIGGDEESHPRLHGGNYAGLQQNTRMLPHDTRDSTTKDKQNKQHLQP